MPHRASKKFVDLYYVILFCVHQMFRVYGKHNEAIQPGDLADNYTGCGGPLPTVGWRTPVPTGGFRISVIYRNSENHPHRRHSRCRRRHSSPDCRMGRSKERALPCHPLEPAALLAHGPPSAYPLRAVEKNSRAKSFFGWILNMFLFHLVHPILASLSVDGISCAHTGHNRRCTWSARETAS